LSNLRTTVTWLTLHGDALKILTAKGKADHGGNRGRLGGEYTPTSLLHCEAVAYIGLFHKWFGLRK